MSENKPLLTIVMPTYNHPDYIRYTLETILNIDEYNILFEIHDSSTDDETKKIVDEYKEKYKNLSYIKYEDIDVDIKTIVALNSVKTKYVHLCGDGAIPNLEKITSLCQKYMDSDFDIIELYDTQNKKHITEFNKIKECRKQEEIVYSNLYDYLYDNIWHLPCYGGSIVKSSIFSSFNEENMKELISCGYVYPYMVILNLDDKLKAVALGDDFLLPNIRKKASIWIKEGRGIELWANKFPNTIYKTKKCSDDEFKTIMIESQKKLNLLTFKGLLTFRMNGNFNFKVKRQYSDSLNKYGACSKFKMNLICLTPKWVLSLLWKIKHIEK